MNPFVLAVFSIFLVSGAFSQDRSEEIKKLLEPAKRAEPAKLAEARKAPGKAAAPSPPGAPAAAAAAAASTLGSAPATYVATPSTQTTSATGTPPLLAAPSKEKTELEKIQTLNQIDQQEFVRKLRPINEEKEETAARYNLRYEKTKLDVAELEAELKRLQLEASLADEKRRKDTAPLRAEIERQRLDNEKARAKLEAEQLRADAEALRISAAMRDLDFQSRKLKLEGEVADHRGMALRSDLELRAKKEEWRKATDREPDYPEQPFKDGVLTVSDRRIQMNGPIVYGVADYVTERIDYYNNKSEKLPIYLVIDRSPGGSVMEGYRIVKAIQTSKAPVHVVVKSFAASMAATIASLAPKSYAYPNAIILHHQIFSWIVGNPTQQKQQLDVINEWNQRLLTPVAKKMGISLEQLTKKMYEHNVDGDWEEFADRAVKLKWIDHVAVEIRETGVLKEPSDKREDKLKSMFALSEESDPKGERYMRLPRLQAYDAYFLFNKDQYYR